MSRLDLLPHWCLTGGRQAFYDTEAGDAIEQTARVYAAVRSLQEDYNKYVDELTKTINEFINSTEKDQEEFKKEIIKISHEYIKMIDEKIKLQDLAIDNAVKYMKDNLIDTITTIIDEMKVMGELDSVILNALNNISVRVLELENRTLYVNYNEANEELYINIKEMEG